MIKVLKYDSLRKLSTTTIKMRNVSKVEAKSQTAVLQKIINKKYLPSLAEIWSLKKLWGKLFVIIPNGVFEKKITEPIQKFSAELQEKNRLQPERNATVVLFEIKKMRNALKKSFSDDEGQYYLDKLQSFLSENLYDKGVAYINKLVKQIAGDGSLGIADKIAAQNPVIAEVCRDHQELLNKPAIEHIQGLLSYLKRPKKTLEQQITEIQANYDVKSKSLIEENKVKIEKIKENTEKAEIFKKDALRDADIAQKRAEAAKAEFAQVTEAAKAKFAKLEQDEIAQRNLKKESDKEFEEKIANAIKNNDIKLQEKLRIDFEKTKQVHEAKMQEILNNKIKVSKMIQAYEDMVIKKSMKGFGKVAGYKEEIKALKAHFEPFIEKQLDGIDIEMPAPMLFFGPKGNGKTMFKESLIEEIGYNNIKLQLTLDPKQDFENLKNAAKQGLERYNQDKTSSIISIDEFDGFVGKDNPMIQEFRAFIENMRKDYNCTIFATTNHPEKIDAELLKGELFTKTALPPSDKNNAAAILKHYAEDFAEENVNYDELAELITKWQPNEAFSNAKIEVIVINLIKSSKDMNTLTQKDLANAIESNFPDIDKKALLTFNQQIQYCKDITSNIEKTTSSNVFKSQLPKVVEDKEFDQFYEVSARQYAKEEPSLKGKEKLMKESLPDLYKAMDNRPDNNTLVEILKVINPENKDFIIKDAVPSLYKASNQATLIEALKIITPENKEFIIQEAIPALERNTEILDLKQSIGEVLKLLTPQTIDCLDKLAIKAKEYKIDNASDTLGLLRVLTPEKKDVAFNELFPYLIENAEKYKFKLGGYMGKILEVTTPENRDFMMNEAIPTIMQNAQKLKIGLNGAIKILGIVDKNNLKTIETIANNIEKYDIRDQDGLFDIEKFKKYINQN